MRVQIIESVQYVNENVYSQYATRLNPDDGIRNLLTAERESEDDLQNEFNSGDHRPTLNVLLTIIGDETSFCNV